jgi:hypothetical protein
VKKPVTFPLDLKFALKRGALLAAANWPVTIVQAVADTLFKLLVAAPLVAGLFLVAVVVGAEPVELLSLGWRDLIATIVGLLISRPLVLVPIVLGVAIAAAGGSLLVFLAKGGALGVLVHSEREAGAVERPPLYLQHVAEASRFSVETFVGAARAFFPRYVRLGICLMLVYSLSSTLYLAAVFGPAAGLGSAALVTVAFVAWITIVNLLYLLTQIVIAADNCRVGIAARRVALFVRRDARRIASVFAVVLMVVVFATGASVMAGVALGLLGFVPFFGPFLGLAVLPLQLVAWIVRALVFQYIGLASAGAYLKLYRESCPGATRAAAAESTWGLSVRRPTTTGPRATL